MLDTRDYKIGDEVKVVNHWDEIYNGMEGIVVGTGKYVVAVEDRIFGRHYNFMAFALERVDTKS